MRIEQYKCDGCDAVADANDVHESADWTRISLDQLKRNGDSHLTFKNSIHYCPECIEITFPGKANWVTPT